MRMEGEWGLAQWLKDEAMGDGAWARGYKMEGGGPVLGGATRSEEGMGGWRMARRGCEGRSGACRMKQGSEERKGGGVQAHGCGRR
jgi:hypothetical protein